MNSKALVYPFDQQFLPLIETNSLPPHLELVHCVSPKGWGFAGKDIGYVAYGPHQGVDISDDFESALASVDVAIFFPYQNYLDRERSLLPKIHQAIKLQKEIYCCCPLDDNEKSMFIQQAERAGTTFHYFDNKDLDIPLDVDLILRHKTLRPITVPIVAIASIMEFSGKLALQLKFAQYMRSQGYKVSVITSKPYAAFIGAHPVPDFLFSASHSESNKILLFNAYVKYIQHTEEPDLILISIPGGLLPVKDDETSWFGITAFEVTRAVTPDASFLISHFENFEPSHIEELVTMFNYRFSLNINAIILNNMMVDFVESKHMSYVQDDVVAGGSLISHSDLPVFNLSNLDGAFSMMVEILSSYSDVAEI